MSHRVEKMMFTGKKPWWYGNSMQGEAIGIDLGENAVSSDVACKTAGLDWDVVMRRAGFLDTRTLNVDGQPVWREAAGESFLVRETDGSVLGRCNDSYKIFQNAEAFAFLDSLVADGQLLYHTAGSLEDGKRVWILAQTPESWTIQRRSGMVNTHHAFINCMLAHDGKGSISLMPTDVRVECANTAGFAESGAERKNLIYRIPHRGDIQSKLALAALAIRETLDASAERREVLQALAQTSMDTGEFIDFATSIFLGLDGTPEEVEAGIAKFYEDATPRSKTIMENKVAKVARLFQSGQGNEGDSGYDALQAFTEFMDHMDIPGTLKKAEKARRARKIVASSWIGAGAERKALVYKRLREKAVRTRY